MVFQNILKKTTASMIFTVVTLLLISQPSYAQNSSLAVKGSQEAFGNLKVVSQYGNVVFADQPDKATIGMLKDHGIKMVITIRGESEKEGYDERKAVEAEGITYIQIPYMHGRNINGEAVDEILELIKITENNGIKIMLHCTHSQRAGSLLGAALYKSGHSREDANKMATNAGMTSEFITKIHNEYLDTIK